MISEVLHALDVQKGDVVIDATFGRGGHSKALSAAAKIHLVTIDADPASGADIVGNFADVKTLLAKAGVKKVDKVLFDLGWNMTQLSSGRGFSFMRDEPLTMSYGDVPRSGFTAAEILNSWSETAIADALYGYGEERFARRIARAVVMRRKIAPFKTTFEFVELIRDSVPAAYRRLRLHPATKSFQALRIAVNDELGAIDRGLRAAWELLAPGGRIAVITFHSIEDRLVKRLFREFSAHGGSALGRKKPLVASRSEVSQNPAARSAKLRVIQKI